MQLEIISEASRRWGDFQGGRPIELPDGQAWAFYEPEAMNRDGLPGWTFGEGVPRDVDAILSARLTKLADKWALAIDEAERACAILEMAWFLLARNYAITAPEFEQIMALATEWPEYRQKALGEQLLLHVGMACMRASQFAEVA